MSCACQCLKIDVTSSFTLKRLTATLSHKCVPHHADCEVYGHAVGQDHGGLLEY